MITADDTRRFILGQAQGRAVRAGDLLSELAECLADLGYVEMLREVQAVDVRLLAVTQQLSAEYEGRA